jgi:hypothetical protein
MLICHVFPSDLPSFRLSRMRPILTRTCLRMRQCRCTSRDEPWRSHPWTLLPYASWLGTDAHGAHAERPRSALTGSSAVPATAMSMVVNKRRTGIPPENGCNGLIIRPEMADRCGLIGTPLLRRLSECNQRARLNSNWILVRRLITAGIAEFECELTVERIRSGIAAVKARGKKLGRQLGQRPKSDRLASKVLALVARGRSYRLVGREIGLSKNTVAGIVKRSRATNPRPHQSPF